MAQLGGYAGRILRVDLSSGEIERVPTERYAEMFLGGRGIAAKIYWDEASPQSRALDPDNPLIFVTGPVTATTGYAGSRWQVCGKSPVHDRFSYCNLGGSWGAGLKSAGYDGLVVSGKAEGPVYLWISSDGASIREAKDLWGLGAISCREALKERLGRSVRVVATGPAGENRVRFATVLADNDSTGSGGFGAVMGSKNLKAVAVAGNLVIKPADPQRVRELRGLERPLLSEITTRLSPLSPQVLEREGLKREICHGCTGCVRTSYRGKTGRRGKFMCQSSFFYEVRAKRYYGGPSDVPFEATKLCDDYGLDTHFVEGVIMWLWRCFKAGLLDEEKTGLPISRIGSLDFIEALAREISLRDGFGDLLAAGIREAADTLGPEARGLITDYTNRNAHTPLYGPRMYIATGIFYAMEPRLPIQQLHEISTLGIMWAHRDRGPEGSCFTSEVFRAIAKRFWGSELAADFSTYEGKALAAARIQDRQYAKESLILCDFAWPNLFSPRSSDHVGDPTLESKLLTAVTGREIDEEGLYRIGERVFNLQRAILAREGHRGREHDVLEDFEYEVPLKGDVGNPDCLVPGEDGRPFSRKGMVVDRVQFERMKDEYYGIRGWDVRTGLQTKAKLQELGLGDVAETLEREGLLA
jgi:aldehyde:ferredoxin oxidoreductase